MTEKSKAQYRLVEAAHAAHAGYWFAAELYTRQALAMIERIIGCGDGGEVLPAPPVDAEALSALLRAGGAEAADAATPGAVEAPGPIEVESKAGSRFDSAYGRPCRLPGGPAEDSSGSDCEKPIVASAEAARPGNSLPDSLRPYDRVNTDAEEIAELKRLDRRQDGEI